MLKKILDNVGINKTIGYLLLCLLFVLYFYLNPSTVKENELDNILVTISEKPIFHQADLNTPPSLTIKSKEFVKPFRISNCSLKLIDKSVLLNLNTGEKIKLTVKVNDIKKNEKQFVNNYISVFAISLIDKTNILSLKDYNSCEKSDWKLVLVCCGILLIIFILILTKKIRKL